MVASIGFMELLFVVLMGGGVGVPLGLPPQPADPALVRAAPEECLVYLSWYGTAAPEAGSKNSTEQLLAEPEVQHLLKRAEAEILAAIKRESSRGGRREEAVLGEEIPKLAKIVLTHPTALFVTGFAAGAEGPDVHAGLVIKTGGDTSSFQTALAKVIAVSPLAGNGETVTVAGAKMTKLDLPPGAPEVVYGFHGEYLIVGVGAGSAEEIIGRMARQDYQASWLTKLHKQVPVERPGMVVHVNVKGIMRQALPLLGVAAFGGGPNIPAIINTLGLGNIDSLSVVSGLDQQGLITKTLLALDGEPKGVLGLANAKPLTAADLRPIPRDATLAFAGRLDLKKVYDDALGIAGRIDRRAREEMTREIERFEDQIGLKLADDVFQPLGDAWRVYCSPSEHGLLGVTAVVSVRDPKTLAATEEKILALVRPLLDEELSRGGRRPRGAKIVETEFGGQKIRFVQPVGEPIPVAPAWCVAGDELIVALYPQAVKSYLARDKKAGSLADVPQVASLLSGSGGPLALTYVDTPSWFKVAYPALQALVPVASSALQGEGVNIDAAIFPAAATIARHLHPDVSAVVRTDAGIMFVSRQSLPVGGAVALLPVGALFFVYEARSVHVHEAEGVRNQAIERAIEEERATEPREKIERAPPPRPPQRLERERLKLDDARRELERAKKDAAERRKALEIAPSKA